MSGHREQSSGGDARPSDVLVREFDDNFFEQLVSTANDGVVTADTDGTIVYVNKVVEDLLGYAPEDLLGTEFIEFVPERFQDRYESWHQRYIDGDDGTPLSDETFEATCQTANGDERRLSVSVFEHYSGDERLTTGFLRNAPERDVAGKRLREEEALVEEIFDTSPVAIAVRDADGELLRTNDRAAEIAGFDPIEIPEGLEDDGAAVEWSLYDASGEPIPEDERPTERVLRTGDPVYNEELVLERANDDRVHLSVSAAPVHQDGAIQRVVTAAEDITELKETQHELERRRSELEIELSEVFSRIGDAFFALNRDWEFTYVNDEAEELLRRTEEELIGTSIWNEFSEAADSAFQREYERAMESQEQTSFVDYYPPLSAWFEVRAYPSETGLSVYFQDVTDRIERERELERYETIVETTDDGIYILDDDMTFSMVNPALAEMTGYDREDVLGRSAWEFVANEDDVQDYVGERVDEMVAGDRTSATVEIDVLTADGGTFPAEILFVVQKTGGGLEHIGIVRDISEQKRRERELRDRVRQQRTLSEFSRHALEDRQLDDLMDEAVELVAETLRQEYSKVLELRPDEDDLLLEAGYGWDEAVLGSATFDTERGSQAGFTLISREPVVVEDFTTEERFSYPDLLASRDAMSGISTIIGTPEDPWGILETHTTDHRTYADHEVQFVQSIAHVLYTAIRRREREQQLELDETIIETVEDGVYALDSDERFVKVNDAFCEMTGYDREELIGEHASVVHSEEINEQAAEMSEDAAEERESATLEFELKAKDGSTIPVESRFGPYRYEDEAFARTGILRDITERKERERELREQNERLDAFASMLAHELRNPLEIAQIYLDMGIEGVVDDADDSAFREVERALDRIEEMIETLLVVTRRGGEVETTEVVALGEKAVEWWERIDPDGTLVVETDQRIQADASRLRQLLENLFRNAEEHGSADCRDGAETSVTVRIGDLSGGFYVEDDGPGIPEDERGRVFESGYSTSNVGIGFGLAVVRQLVEVHGWHCEITESKDGGARFEFTGVEVVEE